MRDIREPLNVHEVGHLPKVPRMWVLIQQGPIARARVGFNCPPGSIYSIDQMWLIFATMRRAALNKMADLTPRVWVFVEPNLDVPPPRYAPGLILFP